MAQYRKKPTIVNAEQIVADKPYPAGVCHLDNRDGLKCPSHIHVHTLEGNMKAKVGYWVLTAADGRQWPVDPIYFTANYELV